MSGSNEINIINGNPIIQESIYGARYEIEYKFTFKAKEIGSNNMIVKLTYNDGMNDITKEVISADFYVVQ